MRNPIFMLTLLQIVIFLSCSGDEGNACRSFYTDLCSKERYFNEPEEYYYQQKILFCNCIKNQRANFTDYEKIECDRYLKSIDLLDENLPEDKRVLQECTVQHELLKKYKDTYISICQMRNGTDECNKSRSECIKACPTGSEEEYKGCVAKCSGQYPCDDLCDGFGF